MDRWGIFVPMLTLKKSLGQHFLKDDTISQRIVAALMERPFSRLLEIGPGGGALTRHLLTLPAIDLKCIEIDHEKVQYLEKTYPALKGKILHQDILVAPKPFEEPFTVVGNFPYNISTEIIFKMLEWRDSIESMTGMFQKEVARRLASDAGSKVYGVTSVLVQTFFKVEYLFEVPETAFEPPPKVQSAVIRLLPTKEKVDMRDLRSFRILVKAAFGQRRKTMRNAVKALFPQEVLADNLFDRRAETFTVNEFAALTHRMTNNDARNDTGPAIS